jgi:hypothetical protein
LQAAANFSCPLLDSLDAFAGFLNGAGREEFAAVFHFDVVGTGVRGDKHQPDQHRRRQGSAKNGFHGYSDAALRRPDNATGSPKHEQAA